MKNILNRLNKVIGSLKSARIPSLEETLRKIVPRQDFMEIVAACCDFREMLAQSAIKIGTSEYELAGRVSHRLGLPYLPRLFPVDLALLPTGITIADCRRAGCIPIFGHGRLSGIACVDPIRAKELFATFGYVPLGISLWITIARALDESERLYLTKTSQASESGIPSGGSDEGQEALNLVCREFSKLNGKSCLVRHGENGEIEYILELSDQKEARGRIHRRVRVKLFSLLEDLAFRGAKVPGFEVNGKSLAVRKTGLVGNGSFELELVSDKVEAPTAVTEESRPKNVIAFPDVTTSARDSKLPLVCENGITTEDERFVLLVDDNPTFARVLERFLAKQGIATRHLSNAGEALFSVTQGGAKPVVIVCDVHMPEMNGFEFVQRLRGEAGLSEIPVVMLTSDDDVETELKLISEGADAFLTKSSDPRLLCVHVRRLIERSQGRTAA